MSKLLKLLFVVFPVLLFANVHKYQVEQLTEADGLSDDVIRWIYQDKYGFIRFELRLNPFFHYRKENDVD